MKQRIARLLRKAANRMDPPMFHTIHNAHSVSSDDVKLAFETARLARAHSDAGKKAAQLIAAEERLNKARRDQARLIRANPMHPEFDGPIARQQ